MSDTTLHVGELGDVELFSGVNESLEPFCQLRATGTIDGVAYTLVGQMDPDRMRGLGMQYLEVAEAAVMDSAVARFFTSALGMEVDNACLAVSHLRAFRSDAQGEDDDGGSE